MKKLIVLLVLLSVFVSCKKNEDIITDSTNVLITNETDNMQMEFAKTLAIAIADNTELRGLIKKEALKKFDNDYDILYQTIKDDIIGSTTVSELLSNYASSKEQFKLIEKRLPLLTIFIPILPNFSPETWNTSSEVPKIAVRLENNDKVPYFDNFGNEKIISNGLIPGFPMLVIKQNERVITNESDIRNNKTFVKGNCSYSFLDETFDGSKQANNKRVTINFGADPISIEAYNLGMEWQRDHVYYGLTPTITTGAYRNNYSEFLTSFRMLSDSWLGKISDQSPDPNVIHAKSSASSPSWTDGYFEFRVDILINSTNGAGSTLTKYFSAKGSDLADVTYISHGFFYSIDKITLKSYNPNLELCPWDLKNYGMAWKFRIYEVDPSEVDTYTEEISTTYAMNFDWNLGEKIGLKFGGSATTSSKSTIVRQVTRDSDDLGEAILTFDQPIITGVSVIHLMGNTINHYHHREITTGWCGIIVEPKKIY